MRWKISFALSGFLALCITFAASPAGAVVPVVFGTSWDGPGHGLQDVVDAYIGVPGAIHVQTDYIGAKPGDLDPWFWVGPSFPALMVTAIAGNANVNELGWYIETGIKPELDGAHDGLVFSGLQPTGANTSVVFPSGTTRFGFYLETHVDVNTPSGRVHELFYTNRWYNDLGPQGAGAIHAPYSGGDVQALVYDVSQWKGPNTWLVCFEDLDSGDPVASCCSGTDNDFNDLVFQVTALGATPAGTLTFGALKARYR